MDTLVSTQWLADHLSDPDLIVLDCSVHTDADEDGIRNSSGYAGYLQGHVPGAGFADLKSDLTDADNPVEFSPPSPAAFCAAMGRLGVGDETKVVLYDNSYTAWAARVWWMLRWVGFDRAALLDGGLKAWTSEGHPLSTALPKIRERQLTVRPRPALIADRAEVARALHDPSVALIDALPPELFNGEITMYARPGHIPGAVNIPGMELLDAEGRFLPPPDLQKMHDQKKATRAITYCGGGILASLNAFAMTRLGYRDLAVYTASLQEWAADPACPMTVKSEKAI